MISDITRMGEWSPETTSARWLEGATKPQVGAKFRGTNALGWRKWSTTCTVTDWEPSRSFAFRVTVGPIKVSDWTYTADATPEGCTLTETWVDLRGPSVRLLANLAAGTRNRAGHNKSSMTTTLARLKFAAEAAQDAENS